jgi:HD-like signal output (HDOD) protein
MSFNWIKRIFSSASAVTAKTDSEVQEIDVSDDKSENPLNEHAAANQPPSKTPLPQKLCQEYIGLLDQAFGGVLYNDHREMPEEPDARDVQKVRELHFLVSQASLDLDHLPRRPSSLPMVMKLLKLDKLSYSNISDALLQDPALTSQVLKTANSPFFRVNEKTVESLEQAIFVLGVEGIKKVVAAAIMKPLFQSERGGNEVNDAIWKWALSSGQVLDRLSSKQGYEPGALYLLGLLPALAMILINQRIDEVESRRGARESLPAYLRLQVFRKNAHALCLQIRKDWGLPESYDTELKSLDCREASGESSLLLDALYVAEYAMVSHKMDPPLNVQQLTALTRLSKEENLELLHTLDASK